MNGVTTQHAGPAVRASDAEREHAVALLQHGFTDGRLTQAELEERAGAAYAARTTAELSDLTADLPTPEKPPRHGRVLDRRLLCILLCVHPPAALVYWLLSLRRQPGKPDAEPATATAAGSGHLRATQPAAGDREGRVHGHAFACCRR
jgi:Domain of unknown function (DUF1707)